MMNSIVLIHGAWHGAWCWNKVLGKLQTPDVEVIAPGVNWDNNRPVEFSSYIVPAYLLEICNEILALDKPVILIGHSFGGMVISQVAEMIPERIRKLVYLSGFLLDNGQCINDTKKLMSASQIQSGMKLSHDKQHIVIPDKLARDGFYNDCHEDDIKYALEHIKPQPLSSFYNQVNISDKRFGNIRLEYIECTLDKAIPLHAQRQMYSLFQPSVVHSLESSHSPFFSQAEALCNTILKLPNDKAVEYSRN